jgi:hypothetical protein
MRVRTGEPAEIGTLAGTRAGDEECHIRLLRLCGRRSTEGRNGHGGSQGKTL